MHTNLFRLLKEFICGVRVEPVDEMSTGFYSFYPKDQLPMNDWMIEYKVGCRYGYRGSYYKN